VHEIRDQRVIRQVIDKWLKHLTSEVRAMNIAKVSVGRNPPYDVNVIVEIPQGSASQKAPGDAV